MSSGREIIIVAAVTAYFIAAGLSSARCNSATADEFAHLAAGVRAWKTGDFSLYRKTPPLGRLLVTLPALLFSPFTEKRVQDSGGWGPWHYADRFAVLNSQSFGAMLFACRAAVILLGAGCGLLVWWFARRGYGPWGGVTAAAALLLSPGFMAHSRLVTTDVAAGLMSLLVALAVIRHLGKPSAARAAVLGLAAGAAAAVKFTLLLFLPALFLAPAAALWWSSRPRPTAARTLAHLAAAAFAAWLALCTGYLFSGVAFHPDYPPASSALGRLRPVLALIPLPGAFVVGLDDQLFDNQLGEFTENNYLAGKWYAGARWYYLPLSLLFKEPVELILLVLLALGLLAFKGPRRAEEAGLLILAAGYFMAASLAGSLQIGVRYLLPVYPLAAILVGAIGFHAKNPEARDLIASAEIAAKGGAGGSRVLQAIVVTALVLAAAENVMIWPHYLSYFNPLAGGAKNGYQKLLDSNLDWGQDLPALARWMRNNHVERIDLAYFGHDRPERFGISYDLPATGSKNRFIAISANLLMGRKYPMTFAPRPVPKDDPLWAEVSRYRGLTPAARAGYSIFIFEKLPPAKEAP